MRFNKNFANVYTPYHEFEEVVLSLEEKKSKRMEQKAARIDTSSLVDPASLNPLERKETEVSINVTAMESPPKMVQKNLINK